MVRGVCLSRAPSEMLTVASALKRYMKEVSVTKKPNIQRSERFTPQQLEAFFGKDSMAAGSADLLPSIATSASPPANQITPAH